MKATNKINRNKKLFHDYMVMINMDRLFFKCLLFFGSILVIGIVFFIFWMSK